MTLYPTPNDVVDAVVSSLDSGYFDVQYKGDAGIVGIAQMLYTHAILAGLSYCGYEDRWCYKDYASAKAALDAWDGADGTEPQNWHRHPSSGRRRDEHGNETIYT